MKIEITHQAVFIRSKPVRGEVEVDDEIGNNLINRGIAKLVCNPKQTDEENEEQVTKRRKTVTKSKLSLDKED